MMPGCASREGERRPVETVMAKPLVVVIPHQLGRSEARRRIDARIGQGRENAKKYLKEHPETADKIEKVIRANAAGISDALMAGPDADDSDSDHGTAAPSEAPSAATTSTPNAANSAHASPRRGSSRQGHDGFGQKHRIQSVIPTLLDRTRSRRRRFVVQDMADKCLG